MFVLQVTDMPPSMVSLLLDAAVISHFVGDDDQPEGAPTYAGATLPLDLPALANVVRRLAALGAASAASADTEVIPAVRLPVTLGLSPDLKKYAYCPDHPSWEPLRRMRLGTDLHCTARPGGGPMCPYITPDPEHLYAN